jgi:cephalosporin-C deacetylase-like acetyl esterase
MLGYRFRISIPTEGLHPGFYELRVSVDTGTERRHSDDPAQHRPLEGVCVFGWKFHEMAIAQTRPADFKEYWDRAKEKIYSLPLDAKEGPMQTFNNEQIGRYNADFSYYAPESDPEGQRADMVESCKVSFAGPDGGRVYAWLAKPKTDDPKQKFPAFLVLPGAGNGGLPRPLEQARHGYVALYVQVHGFEVDGDDYTGKYMWISFTYDDADEAHGQRIYLRALQALRYLASRDDVDTSRIVVGGGSQGGRLTTIVAGLEPNRVAAAIPYVAHGGNYPYTRWTQKMNGVPLPWSGDVPAPGSIPQDGMDITGAPPLYTEHYDLRVNYFDPMNFALDATCPVMINAAMIDPVSPTTIYAIYRNWGGTNKTFVPIPAMGHDHLLDFDRMAYRWLDDVLGN